MKACRFVFRAAFVLVLLMPRAAWSLDLNAFFPPRGQGDVAFSITSESYDEFWVGTTKVAVPDIGEVETTTATIWARWGLTDRIALVANLPYVDVDSDGLAGFSDSGLQDLAVLASFRVAAVETGSVRHVVAAAAGARTPLSDYEADAPVSIGDGTTDLLARFVYQLESGPFYFSQQVGYDVRGEDAPDGFPLATEVGYSFGRVTLSGHYFVYVADGGTDIGDPGFTFPSNQDETERLGLKAHFRLDERLGLSASGFTTLDGRNSGDASGFSAGVVASF